MEELCKGWGYITGADSGKAAQAHTESLVLERWKFVKSLTSLPDSLLPIFKTEFRRGWEMGNRVRDLWDQLG